LRRRADQHYLRISHETMLHQESSRFWNKNAVAAIRAQVIPFHALRVIEIPAMNLNSEV
jgi:hypothetical protein